MIIDKLKYLIGPASGMMSHPLGRSRFIFVRTYGCRDVGLCSRGGCPGSTDWKERGKVAWARGIDPHACALGSPGQDEIRFRIVRLSRHEIA